ncbi:leucine-rich repeat-containing protein 42 [Xenopus laevis]|uniref:Leucine-rich repeat-containing protein 42 n=2 Tax=Xenopus laevis TaxID=8355 RepID=LRC42_XENLA|nr:leucine-rich repeat-containing protein 42 [Xenopus laevis]XP_041446413.1 leucine-rich repeat-containing protein 42 [Xenopus laevis]Q4KLV2.2 RecName: Full=Leucine-rich repeat-containing protein 42 [Xenopus laevis]
MFQCLEPERNEEAGLVYVREKGKLSVIGSHSSELRTRPCRLFSKGFSVELCGKQEDTSKHRQKPFIFTYTKEGSLRYSAKSLFTLTLELISDNIQYVDSLMGFPDQIAEKLFTAAEAKQKFYAPCSGLMALRKFTEAYGDLVLSSLCLRGRYLLVSERLEEIKSFQCLHSLDLSCCKLGDEHELLAHLSSDPMSSLTELYLKDNCLSNIGIQKMTASVRVLGRGLDKLKVLDLSSNPGITDRGVCFLFGFKLLKFLDLSDTSIQDPSGTLKKIETKIGLVLSKKSIFQFDHTNCRTQGWAEQLLEQWESYILSAIKPKDTLKSRNAAQQFYGKEKKQIPSDSGTFTLPAPVVQKQTHLQFFRPKEQKDPDSSNSEKRRHSTKRTGADCVQEDCSIAPSTKRPRVTLTSSDWDLLNSY